MKLKEKLILTGINEIEKVGLNGLSLRKVAAKCGVSCAAPYRHFDGKQEFILEIFRYVNEKWSAIQDEIAEKADNKKETVVEICIAYIKFLVENPSFRSILMLKHADLDDEQRNELYSISKFSEEIVNDYCVAEGITEKSKKERTLIVRAMLYGMAHMFDMGEVEYNEDNLMLIRDKVVRKFV
ncbi:MAG: TetR/AcrR family transcriptional regulator [Ruminococcaceae bacterium]|jgi:AcrR family transcriptional regulator|nr:TetR/AcrR family transcriptional regulator [Oscillospiraceae bacterium]